MKQEFNFNLQDSLNKANETYGTEYKSKLGKTYSMTQLQQDREFNKRAERFLETIGEDDNIIEYLRDSDYSLTSAMQRASEIGNWSDQTKRDYVYLRDKYSKADLTGAKEWAGFAKDFAIDMVADPLNIVTALFAIPSMGTSLAARTAAGELVKQGLKKYSASKLGKVGLEAAKKPAIFGAVEGSAWNGAHEYFLQDQDVTLDVRPEGKDWKSIAQSTALGGGIGLGAGAGLGLLNGYKYLNKLNKYANEDDIRKTIKGKSVDDIVDEFEVHKAFEVKSPSKLSRAKEIIDENVVGALFGKSTTKFIEKAKSSETLTKLMQHFRYDFGESMFGGDTARVLTQSYGEAKGRRMGFYLARLDRSLNKLYRRGWSGKIDEKDNAALLAYIINPRKRTFLNPTTNKTEAIPDYVKVAGKEIRDLNKKMFDEGLEVGLFDAAQEVPNYFPRMFNFTAISEGRDKFEKLLIKSGHANPINKVQKQKTTETVEGVGVIEGVEENLVASDRELFGRDFLKEANGNLKLAKEIKAGVIVDGMLDNKIRPIEVRMDGGRGGGQTWLQNRVFSNIKDEDLLPYLETDVEHVLRNYYTSAAQTVTRTDFFGRTVADFDTKFIKDTENKTGIYYELKDAGFSEEQVQKALEKIRETHQRITGLDYAGTQFKTKGFQEASNWGRLIQQMAHLPLATISSISEPIILLQRAGLTDSPQAVRDMTAALGKNLVREIDRGLGFIARGVFRTKTKGTGISKTLAETKVGKKISKETGANLNISDLDNDAWFEIYETGLALEQAVMDRLEGLTGDALTNQWARSGQNAFFKMNLLDQWTRTVQLASFTSGKRAITRNSEKLFEHYSGIKKLSSAKVKYLEGQLKELGINPEKAATWYRNSLDDNFQFNINKASKKTFKGQDNSSQANFYRESVLGGANRFTKEVILNPSTAEANRPLWFSSPTGQLLMQFAGYPTVFTNTVLKRFVKDMGVIDLAKGDVKRAFLTSPRTLGAAMTMTAVAVVGDYIRSKGKSIDEDNLDFKEILAGKSLPNEIEKQVRALKKNIKNKQDLNRIAEDSEVIFNAIRRWGGFGPFDYGARFAKEIEYNDNLLVGLGKSFAGPLPQDLIDEIRYGSGLFGLIGRNLPGSAAYDLFGDNATKNVKDFMRDIDEELGTTIPEFLRPRDEFKTGGEVEVPQAPDEPDERIDKLTGLPYNQEAGTAFQDAEERLSFAEGTEVDNSLRLDGTKKSQVGWKGRIKNNVTGKIMTELSVGKPNTEEGFYPLINPYTTDKQIDFIQNFDFEKNNIFETKIGKQMNMNARKHYRESLEKNVSPFVNDNPRQNLNNGGPPSNQKEYDKRLEEVEKLANMRAVNKEAQMNMLMGEGYTDPRFIKSTGNALIDKYGMRPFPAEGSGLIPSSKQIGVEGPDIIYSPNTLGFYNLTKDKVAFKDLDGTLGDKVKTQIHEFVHRAADKTGYFDNFYKSKYLKKEAPSFAGGRGKQLTNLIDEALAHSYEYDDLKDDKLREDIEFRTSQYNLYEDDKKIISYQLFRDIGKIRKDFEDYLEKYDKEKTKELEK